MNNQPEPNEDNDPKPNEGWEIHVKRDYTIFTEKPHDYNEEAFELTVEGQFYPEANVFVMKEIIDGNNTKLLFDNTALKFSGQNPYEESKLMEKINRENLTIVTKNDPSFVIKKKQPVPVKENQQVLRQQLSQELSQEPQTTKPLNDNQFDNEKQKINNMNHEFEKKLEKIKKTIEGLENIKDSKPENFNASATEVIKEAKDAVTEGTQVDKETKGFVEKYKDKNYNLLSTIYNYTDLNKNYQTDKKDYLLNIANGLLERAEKLLTTSESNQRPETIQGVNEGNSDEGNNVGGMRRHTVHRRRIKSKNKRRSKKFRN